MERTILSSLAFAATLGASAHLAPTADAPLYQHMLEVNKEWRSMDPALAADTRSVHFTCESERIATHLFHVRAYLQAHAPEGLSAEAIAERSAMLAELEAYAGHGVFPINDVVDHRNPVFIDRIGTACAVGHLIIASGSGEISQSIHDATNLAYVHELQRTDLMDWAATHGFTKNELAWIQPGYPSMVPWTPLAGGVNNVVRTVATTNSGLFYGGDFTACDTTISALHVASYDGTYSPLGAGVAGSVTCSAVLNGTIYVGGSNLPNGSDLGWWNGSTWQFANVFSGKFPVISALCVHNNELYAAGATLGFAGADDYVQRLHNGNWETVGATFNGPVNALVSHNGVVVAGGLFTQEDTPGGGIMQHVAYFDESMGWMQLGDGLDGTVHTFLSMGDLLYAGGDLWNGSTAAFGLALLTDDVASWIPQLPNHEMYLPGQTSTSIFALAPGPQGIYFGGDFLIYVGMEMGRNMGYLLGAPDAVQAMGNLDGTVFTLNVQDEQLIAGGGFQNAAFLASTDLSTGIHDNGVLSIRMGVRPNPANGPVTITLDRDATANATLDVLDASGRMVMAPVALRGRTSSLDMSGLPEGAYLFRVRMDGATAVARFVKL